jgi:hypothetical protein
LAVAGCISNSRTPKSFLPNLVNVDWLVRVIESCSSLPNPCLQWALHGAAAWQPHHAVSCTEGFLLCGRWTWVLREDRWWQPRGSAPFGGADCCVYVVSPFRAISCPFCFSEPNNFPIDYQLVISPPLFFWLALFRASHICSPGPSHTSLLTCKHFWWSFSSVVSL